MSIDPSSFHLINVADTCSVWNVLSSPRLHAAAIEANCKFCMTSYVRYECLSKPRKRKPTSSEAELIGRLVKAQARGNFPVHSCQIGDLQAIQILEGRKRLGKGELSTIAFAMRISQAVITDDMKARKLAESSGHALTQTTSHLFAWLVFNDRLDGSDKRKIISQHEEMDGPLAPHLERAYEMALQCKLNATSG